MEKQDAITWLKKIPKKNIGKVFLIDDISGSKITFDQLEVEACRISSSLYELGLKKGDHLAIILNNSPLLVKLYFGCLYAGIVVIPVNPTSALQEIEYIINHSKVKNIVVSPETEDKVNVGFFKENGIRTLNIIDGEASIEGFFSLKLDDSASIFTNHRAEITAIFSGNPLDN